MSSETCLAGVRSARAADGNRVNLQAWLANADRHGLSGLAAGADTVIHRKVIADH